MIPTSPSASDCKKPLLRDVWHVALFGQVLPGTLDFSRPLYAYNQQSLIGSLVGAARGHYHLVRFQGDHLNPIWDAIAKYVKTVHDPRQRPAKVEAP